MSGTCRAEVRVSGARAAAHSLVLPGRLWLDSEDRAPVELD